MLDAATRDQPEELSVTSDAWITLGVIVSVLMLVRGIEKTGALTPVMQSTLGERGWADRRGVSASKLLMPVIGTSTNLVVSGQMDSLGLREIGFFEIGSASSGRPSPWSASSR